MRRLALEHFFLSRSNLLLHNETNTFWGSEFATPTGSQFHLTAMQEYELFQCGDSLVLEDEEMKKREWGVRHDGHMEGEASRGLLCLGRLEPKIWAGSFKDKTPTENKVGP